MSFRFTIRDLLWLTALAAICTAWWLDDRQLRSSLDRHTTVFPMVHTVGLPSFFGPPFDGDPEPASETPAEK